MKEIQAFFFDFDGVLADSVEVKTQAFARLFEPYGAEIVAKVVDHHRRHGGMTRVEKFRYYYKEFLKETLTVKMLADLCLQFSQLVVDEVVKSPEIKGAKAFLTEWYDRLPCFVISATPDDEVREIVRRRGLEIFLREALGSSASKTENLKRLLDKYRFNPAKCIFFGDAESDYRAAKNCGVEFIAILPGPDSPLLKIAPDVRWVNDFEALMELPLLIEPGAP
jgi:phosphoglycolate phosphatase-like HAD superfamily hydrolase